MRRLLPVMAALALAAALLNPLLLLAEEPEPVGVVVLPFELSQQGAYDYLGSAARQMLVSRLAARGPIAIVEADVDQAPLQPGQVLRQSGADWLVEGKLYSLKDSLQLNLRLFPAAAGVGAQSFTLRAATPEEVIPAIASLAEELSGRILPEPAAETVAEEPETAGLEGLEGFQTPHPERDFKKGLYGGAGVFGEEGDDRFASRGIRKSSELPLIIESMTLGDLDGDGTDELIAASRSRIRLFHFQDARFTEVARYDFSPNIKIHVINVAALGDSGQMRLVVSANDGRFPSSYLFSYDGGDRLQLRQRQLRWYLRPLEMPGKGTILIGQKDSPNLSDNFLAPGIYELSLDDRTGTVERGERLLLPPKTNLFDFVIVDLDGDSSPETVVVDSQQKLLIYDETLNLIWVSSASYGGSKRFFGPPLSQDSDQDRNAYDEALNDRRQLVYIPGRLDVKDITGDGLPEVVVSSNEVNLVSEYLNNSRTYDGGSVACLSWRGSGLIELWRTNHIQGYVADYVFDGSGGIVGDDRELYLNRLYVGQIPDATIWDRLIPGASTSRILAYEMTVRRESSDQPEGSSN